MNATPVLGLIQNALPDPCQGYRNNIGQWTRDLATAKADDWSNSMIAGAQKQMSEARLNLGSCVASHQSGPPHGPSRSTGVVQGTGTAKM